MKKEKITRLARFGTRASFAAALILQFYSPVSHAQTLPACGNAGGTMPSQSAAPPTNCTQLLNDLVPTGNDAVIDVSVRFFVFQPQWMPNTGAWTNGVHTTTQADAQHCLDIANGMMANMPAPTRPVNGVTSITNAKIRYVMDGFYVVTNTNAYNNLNAIADNTFPLNYKTTNHINVFLGNEEPAFNAIYAGCPGVYPDNYIIFHPQFGTYNPDWDNIYGYGPVFAHEAGHVLGLNHTTSTQNYQETTTIAPSYGCCNYAEVIDYFRDSGSWDPCPGVTNPYTNQSGTGSNNIMSQNTACGYQYLSPQQVAVMHYNLRTNLKNLLTTSGANPGIQMALDRNPYLDYNVTTNETWNTDRYFKGNVIVKSGKTLTINCGVAMSRYAKILVETGGQLIVQNSGHVTNISQRLWDGIEVAGTPNQPQMMTHPTNTGALLYQGIARIRYGATISNARTAVKNYSNGTLTQAGGVLFGQSANFINNVTDCDFRNSFSNYSALIPSISWLYGCNMKTTAKLNENASPFTHVYIYKTKGVKLMGCNFEYAAGSVYPVSPGYGIYSMDGSYTVDKNGATPCTFINLNRGIFATNTNVLPVVSVKYSQFINNVYYGAYFSTSNYLVFDNNFVQNPAGSAAAGIYLNSNKYYKLTNNTFTEDGTSKSSSGVCAYNSKNGAHLVYKNTFSKLKVATNAIEDNSGLSNNVDGLKLQCNTYSSSNPNIFDISLTKNPSSGVPPSIALQQGNINVSPYNTFGAVCSNQNKFFVDGSSTKAIFYPMPSAGGIYDPGAPSASCKSMLVITSAGNVNSCPASLASSGGTGPINIRLASVEGYISNVRQQDPVDPYEYQNAVCGRLSILLGDSVETGLDSATAVFAHNTSGMTDADLQEIFSYMYKGDMITAQTKISMLPSERADWVALLNQLIEIEQSQEGVYSLCQNEGLKSLMIERANTVGAEGREIAQALLFAACGTDFYEPNPDPSGSSRPSETSSNVDADGTLLSQQLIYEDAPGVFPNPASKGINVSIPNLKDGQTALVRISDAVGRLILSTEVSQQTTDLDISHIKPGLYFISMSGKGGYTFYKEKLVIE